MRSEDRNNFLQMVVFSVGMWIISLSLLYTKGLGEAGLPGLISFVTTFATVVFYKSSKEIEAREQKSVSAASDVTPQPPVFQWPRCNPPSSDSVVDEYAVGGKNYKKEEVEPGVWHWVEDREANEIFLQAEKTRQDLWWALRTTLLTPHQMKMVRGYGSQLNIEPMIPYNQAEKTKELNDALANQARLQLLATEKSNQS